MATAMRLAVEAGRLAYLAGPHAAREVAVPSSPHTRDARRMSRTPGAAAMAARGAVTERARSLPPTCCADLRGGELLDSVVRAAHRSGSTRAIVAGRGSSCTGCCAGAAGSTRCSPTACAADSRRLDPDLIDLLRLGVYQLLSMGSVPAYAAIAQTVELAKRRHGIGASKLVNAVLRRAGSRARSRSCRARRPTDPVDALALHALASALARGALDGALGCGRHRAAARGEQRRGAARRCGRIDVVREQLEAMLEGAGVHVADAPLVSDSIRAHRRRRRSTELGAFQAGAVLRAGPGCHARDAVRRDRTGQHRRRPVRGSGRKGPRAVAVCRHRRAPCDRSFARLARMRGNVRRARGAQHRSRFVGDAREPALATGGRGADRRAVHRHRYVPPSSRRAVAAQGVRSRGDGRDAAIDPARGGHRWCARADSRSTAPARSSPRRTTRRSRAFWPRIPEWRLEPPPEGAVPSAVLDAGRLRVLPQRHGTDGAFAARLRRPIAAHELAREIRAVLFLPRSPSWRGSPRVPRRRVRGVSPRTFPRDVKVPQRHGAGLRRGGDAIGAGRLQGERARSGTRTPHRR